MLNYFALCDQCQLNSLECFSRHFVVARGSTQAALEFYSLPTHWSVKICIWNWLAD